MEAIKLLKHQHREIGQLFKATFNAEGREKERLFFKLADNLAMHTTIEEKIFYPAVRNDKTEEELQEAVKEHLQIKRLLAELLDLDTSDGRFNAVLEGLEEQVNHHIAEEEREILVAVQQSFSRKEREELGARMASMSEQLLQQKPRNDIPSQTDHAATL